jgi:rhodanese-related sulfurtransferase
MRYLIISVVVWVVWCCGLRGQSVDTVRFINAGLTEFREAMGGAEKPLLIDVRESFEFRKKRIKGAVSIPYPGSIRASADTIGRECTLLIYCTTGVRSKWAAKIYYDFGFRRIYSLDGGIKGWMEASLPVDRKKSGLTKRRGK